MLRLQSTKSGRKMFKKVTLETNQGLTKPTVHNKLVGSIRLSDREKTNRVAIFLPSEERDPQSRPSCRWPTQLNTTMSENTDRLLDSLYQSGIAPAFMLAAHLSKIQLSKGTECTDFVTPRRVLRPSTSIMPEGRIGPTKVDWVDRVASLIVCHKPLDGTFASIGKVQVDHVGVRGVNAMGDPFAASRKASMASPRSARF